MNTSNRASLISKCFRVLKKHYKPVAPPTDRSVLEHLLYACCLENSKHEQADEVLAKLQQNYFDWNEVRVTTVAELSEVMSVLSDPHDAATRLKRSLHGVFETHYTFDLEFYKKQNLGKAVKEFEKLPGVTPFTVAYITQNALSGHSIPVNRGGLSVFHVVGVISANDAEKRRVPGLERAIPKTKGVEFGSLLHGLSVEFDNSPHSPRLRNILLEISPDAKERFPKRGAPKAAAKPAAKAKGAKKTAAKTGGKKAREEPKAAARKKKKSSTKRLSKKKPR